MSVQARIDGFLKTAEEDLRAAEVLIGAGSRLAAFHIQQAIEKATKAALIARGVEAGAEHRLDVLLEKLSETDPTRVALWPMRNYSSYATAFRYPTPAGRLVKAPPRAEMEERIDSIKEHIVELRERLLPKRDERAREREHERSDDDERSRTRRR